MKAREKTVRTSPVRKSEKHRRRHGGQNQNVDRKSDQRQNAGLVNQKRQNYQLGGNCGRNNFAHAEFFWHARKMRLQKRRNKNNANGRQNGKLKRRIKNQKQRIPNEHQNDRQTESSRRAVFPAELAGR